MPGCGHAERALQASWWQEHGAAHAGGPRAQQASKLETRLLLSRSEGGTVARAGGNACGPPSARLDLLKAPRGPAVGYVPLGPGLAWPWIPLLRLTLERKHLIIRQLCSQREQNIVENRTGGGRHQPLKFLSSHPRVPDDGRDRALDGGQLNSFASKQAASYAHAEHVTREDSEPGRPTILPSYWFAPL